MTIREVIQKLDERKPNSFSELDKIEWLSKLDGQIKKNIFDVYEDGDSASNLPYGSDTSLDTVLLVPAPYEDIYYFYLAAQVDLANDELNNYNNNMAMFNSIQSSFRNDYNRTHTTKKVKYKFF